MKRMKLYHPRTGESIVVPDIDAQGWIQVHGYLLSEPMPEPTPVETESVSGRMQARSDELQRLLESEGWRAIRAIAWPLGIDRPKDGWDAAIPLIVEAELGY